VQNEVMNHTNLTDQKEIPSAHAINCGLFRFDSGAVNALLIQLQEPEPSAGNRLKHCQNKAAF
jgi:hypothetical protein